jgi:hypothetical protein
MQFPNRTSLGFDGILFQARRNNRYDQKIKTIDHRQRTAIYSALENFISQYKRNVFNQQLV